MQDPNDTIYFREVCLEEYFLNLVIHPALFDQLSDQLILQPFQNHLLLYHIDG